MENSVETKAKEQRDNERQKERTSPGSLMFTRGGGASERETGEAEGNRPRNYSRIFPRTEDVSLPDERSHQVPNTRDESGPRNNRWEISEFRDHWDRVKIL